ncbi:hypothetical protein B0H15DRAFT_945260 [Mycena belliarum]|uniref:F-box domain-containing protein n=1 Tax=Mycena belliarum TaxID=1033014 RepID=A0AAD6XVH1_9AGAR|nr:hypothetical protein B0H15DRAFT_945260 [Mycena belliae]
MCTINNLATEVLQEIFGVTLLLFDEEWEDSWSEKCSMQTTILSVCRSWRDICLAAPSLWTRLRLHLFTRPDLLVLQLGRGKQSRLTITIDLLKHEFFGEAEGRRRVRCRSMAGFLASVLSLLGSSFNRVVELRIFCTHRTHWPLIAGELSRFDTGQLTKLLVSLAPGAGRNREPAAVFSPGGAITCLTFSGLGPSGSTQMYCNLRTLLLGMVLGRSGYTWAALHAVLSAAEKVEVLGLDNVEVVEIDVNVVAHLPHLTTLMANYGSDTSMDVLGQLHAPSLRTFAVWLHGADASLARFSATATHLLGLTTTFDLSCPLPIEADVRGLLARLYCAEQLHLRWDAGAALHLMHSALEGRLLPRLAVLRLLGHISQEQARLALLADGGVRRPPMIVVAGEPIFGSWSSPDFIQWSMLDGRVVGQVVQCTWDLEWHLHPRLAG